MASPLIFGLFTTTDLLIGTAAVGALLIAFRPASATKEPTSTPTQTQPNGNKSGVYIPFYGGPSNTISRIKAAASAHPSIPFIVTINPQSGPGDEFCGSDFFRSDIQNTINTLREHPNIKVIGYIGSWYGRAVDSPPQGSQWDGCHFGVVYSMSQTQVNQIKAAGGKAMYVPNAISKYGGGRYTNVQGLMVDEGPLAGDSNVGLKETFYRSLMADARSKGLNYIVVNPGTTPPAWCYTSGGPDNISVAETNDSFSEILGQAQSEYAKSGGNKFKIKVLGHGTPFQSVPTDSQLASLIPVCGYMYFKESNAWHTGLPAYFETLCNKLDALQ